MKKDFSSGDEIARGSSGGAETVTTASNLRVAQEWVPSLAPSVVVALNSLPISAALIKKDGVIEAVNGEWLKAFPSCVVESHSRAWCDAIHPMESRLKSELILGVARALEGQKFVQDYGDRLRYRVRISPCSLGALILHEEIARYDAQAAEQKNLDHRMQTAGRLMGSVAHDFANLLTLIAGYSDILLNRLGVHDPLRAEADEIRQAANRGARLTSQLLGFTRGQTSELKVLDLNGLIDDVQRMLRPIIGEYVELWAHFAPDLGKVLADPGQLERVVMNLVLNARDAIAGGGSIHIRTSNCELDEVAAAEHSVSPGSYVALAVSDNGHGIGADALAKLFQPFYTTKEPGRGTGLGLSTVQEIIRSYGGDVWAKSAPGQGATFTVCLPRVAQAPERTESSSTNPSPRAGNETILLVEDEDSVRRLLSHVLQKRGYTVWEASDGERALELFNANPGGVHLVLTDMVMPRMSGRELADRLCAVRQDLKVVYMSGYTDDVLVRTGSLGPGMSFLQKPLRPDVLVATIREALDSSKRPFNPR